MPELAEVDIARQQLLSWWRPRQAISCRILDDALLPDASQRQTLTRAIASSPLTSVRRRGKYLALGLDSGLFVILHLRMTGFLDRRAAPDASSTARLAIEIDRAERPWICLEDSRRLATLTLHDASKTSEHPFDSLEAFTSQMGPEPHALRSGAELRARLGATTRRLKDALLDQRVIAGVGNIAISELFHVAAIHPRTRANQVSDAALDALVKAMPPYFDALIDAHPIEEPMRYVNQGKKSERDPEHDPFLIYGHEKELCPSCRAAPVERLTFGGRSTYYCPACQPEE